MSSIPAEFHELFERRTFAHVATVMPDGTPHVTPVWVDYDPVEDRVLVNTQRGNQKVRNVRRNPRVGVSMLDPDDPYRYLSIAGEVDALTEAGAREHIDELSRRYLGEEYDESATSPRRVILKIRPDRVL